MFKRILIANRGEIAVRVFRACRELDIQPVVVYSQADADALHVQLAEEAYCIGPARSADSYLNTDAILTVATAAGCDAVHPGYGFLSENADFADACAQAGVTFIGPSGDVIRAMGNKAAARKLMQRAGVPVVPGSDGAVASAREARDLADAIGYPVLIKASAGGGGRGCAGCTTRSSSSPSLRRPGARPSPASAAGSSTWKSSSWTPGTSNSRSWPTARDM